jgi:DNA-binding SARP family transcriptional activator/tetratricopeptide (TPR) repeat protein
MLAAKSAPPYPAQGAFRQSVLDRAAEGPITLFTAPAGYLLTESLAAALAEYRRPTLWLRLGPEDRDPATFLLSFITAVQRLCPGVGATTLELMRRQPGPAVGWQPLFAHLARQVADALPSSIAVVLENIHYLNDTHSTLGLLGLHLLSAVPSSGACILTSRRPLHPAALPVTTTHRGVRDLRIDVRTALSFAERAHDVFPASCLERALALSEGRTVVIAGLVTACARLGPTLIKQAVERARGTDDLLAWVARAWLATANSETLQSLAVAVHLEYSFPALVGHQTVPADPWMQPLVEGWARVRQVWRDALPAAFPKRAVLSADTLRRVAEDLSRQEASEQAVSLYFDLGDTVSAAQVIAGAADRLMNLGQWETLGDWLDHLPESTAQAFPGLVYDRGEIAAAQGNPGNARRAFARAAELFAARPDSDGACQSLLAESTLAAWQGDHPHAQARAKTASEIAEAANLPWHKCWAAWQLGCLAAAEGDLDQALDRFNQATRAAGSLNDPVIIELLREAENLAVKQRDLRQEREYHRQRYFAAERAENETAERLRQWLSGPRENLDGFLGTHGWSRTPLMVKLTAPIPLLQSRPVQTRSSLWESLLGSLGTRLRRGNNVMTREAIALALPPQISPVKPPNAFSDLVHPTTAATPSSTAVKTQPSLEVPASKVEVNALEPKPAKTDSDNHSDAAEESSTVPTLTAYLLGTFRVAVNYTPVENWPSNKGRTLLKYLLTHRDKPASRDVLMEVFWPNGKPETVRNRLNVALHGLRQTLRAAADVPVVIFQDDAYVLNPDLRLWLDVEEFERHIQIGRQLEADGHIASATAEYEIAIGSYQGDFLADDLYEDWAVLTRERLRADYLDTVDTLSRIHFSQGQYGVCATLCQLILSRDNCREDAHRLLMRCYSRQGQAHLALRQHQACVEALRDELDVAPAPETTQLYERIRRRERV